MDRIDDALSELGGGLPFAVDWEAFERQTLERLQAAQRRERRRVAFAGAVGLFSGVAATVALMLNFAQPPVAPLVQNHPAPAPLPAAANGPSAAVAVPDVQHPEQQVPIHRMVRNPDGSVSRIVFYGFSPDSSTAPVGAISGRRTQ